MPPIRISLMRPVSRALEALPVQFSAVVRLVDLEECSYKDAAAELAVPVGTVMSRLFRGRRLLAEALAEPEHVPEAA
jgi:RNA polymerase sigma-70 factor (ECF subfamily)